MKRKPRSPKLTTSELLAQGQHALAQDLRRRFEENTRRIRAGTFQPFSERKRIPKNRLHQ